MNAARKAVKKNPYSAEAWTNLGSFFASRGRLEKAKDCFTKAIQLSPQSAAALNNLATVCQRLGQYDVAKQYYDSALTLAPGSPDIILNLASLLGTLGSYREALDLIHLILRKSPSLAKVHLVASAIAANLGQFHDALTSIDKARALSSNLPTLATRRADILRELGRCDEALAECEIVLAEKPEDAETLHVKALILRALNKADQALACLATAESVSGTPAKIIADKAWFLAELGRKQEALDALDQALRKQRDLAVAWYCKSFLTRYQSVNSDILTMETLSAKSDLNFRDRLGLHFALGKAYLDIGDGEKAFANLGMGNKLKRSVIDYNRFEEENRVTEIIEAFRNLPSNLPTVSHSIPGRPIFVFGMPRSGTTLIDQILASHRLVSSIGEGRHIDDAGQNWITAFKSGSTPVVSASEQWVRKYVEAINVAACEGHPFVDKTPANFRFAGVIRALFPEARMIHCRRTPLDTCLSCYSLLFTHGHEYTYDLTELGHYYRLYQRLMAHWQATLPPGSMLEVDYESLVDDTAGQIRRMLDYCSLPWDENCLKFHETRRIVATASLDQVRSPIYRSSVGRAQRFRAWLSPLEAALQVPTAAACTTNS
jgi:tetratricopeptide (TPR) repeat protein